jgi:pyruvate-formate lyase-activating enzyme
MRTAIIYIAARCNQDCVFCLEVNGSWTPFVDPTTAEVYAELDRLYGRGARQITFMGGETFFRKDLPRILGQAKKVGFSRIGVTTNGTVLSKKGFVQNLLDNGLDFIEFSVHGHTPELANAIAQTNYSFERQAEALDEVNEIGGPPVIVNVVVCRENKDHLLPIAEYICRKLSNVPLRIKFKFVSMTGLAGDRSERGDEIRYEDVDVIPVGDFLEARGVQFWFHNFPLCRLGRHASHAHEIGVMAVDESYFDFDHRGHDGYYDSGFQLEGHVWPGESCASCNLKVVCPGIEESYRRASGSGGLAVQTADPLPLIEGALRYRSVDPAQAPARLELLRRQPRPAKAVIHRTDKGFLRFHHDQEPNNLDISIADASPDKRAFIKSPRFALSYEPWPGDDGMLRRPNVLALMEAAGHAMEAADARGLSLEETIAAVSGAAAPGWSCLTPPPPAKAEPATAPSLVRLARNKSEPQATA